jgi:phage terminase large subunit
MKKSNLTKAMLDEYMEDVSDAAVDDDRELSVEATDIFFRNQKSKAQIIINRGGAGSSKSYSLCQLMLYKFFTEEKKKILILRKALPSLRLSCYLVMNQLANEYGLRDRIIEEKVHMNWYYNGSMIHFGSVDDPEKLKSSDFNYIWFEEATEFSMVDFNTLRLRLRAKSKDGLRNQMYLSFNPIDEFHWIKTKILDDPTYDADEIVSTYRDNPYIMDDADYVQTLENLQHQDMSFYNVYALGNWGKLENVIYQNWDSVDWTPDENAVDFVCYGLDFGYNDPTSFSRYKVKGNEVWSEELLYHVKLTNGDLITRMLDLIPPEKRRHHIIYADSAEPDRIQEIKTAGFNIKPALKQINPGIDYCKQLKIHVHSTSINTVKELRAYSWRKDKDGNATDIPIDFMNHAMDQMRYALYTSKKKSGGLRIRML